VARISAVIHIDASPQEVWDVATDLGLIGRWVTIHRDFPDGSPPDLEEGSRFRQTLRVAGVTFRVEWTATEVEGPVKLTWEGTGPAGTRAHTGYGLEAEGGGTRFTYSNEFTLPAGRIGKVAARAVAGQAEKQVNDSLRALKRLVETAPRAAAGAP
jgi:uncharacterized protein YndB with AHSA1/START domain